MKNLFNGKRIAALILMTELTILGPGRFAVAQSNEMLTPPAAVKEAAPAGTESKAVKAIEIKGNKTISVATILSKIKTRVGQEYIQTVVSDDLKRLYNTGYFSDVRVDREDLEGGFKVIIFVTEKGVVSDVTFSKTRYIPAVTLKRKIKTQIGKFLDSKVLKEDTETIKDLYAKKGLTLAEVEAESFVDEVTNKVSVHFVIREGYRVIVRRINFEGNRAFRDGKIISVIKLRKKRFFNSAFLKEETLKEDMERIASFYEQQGYIDAAATYKINYMEKGRVEVDIFIKEGKRYYVGNVTVAGNAIISNKEILGEMKNIKSGGIFSRNKLSLDLASIRTLYFDHGYIFANVADSTSIDPQSGKVEVKINIEEGKLAYIERIKIEGNTRTRDIVIRRELKLQPGDRFDGSKLRRSKEKLTNLGYFEDVGFDMEDTNADDRKNLVVQVKEAKTGTFSFGGGFSTVDKMVGFVEIEQRNFDITNWPTFTGGGQKLQLRGEIGSTKNNQTLSFTEPWLFDYPVSGGFDAYRSVHSREQDTGYAYDEQRIGGVIRFGKQFTDYIDGSLFYKNEQVKISNFVDNLSKDVLAEQGKNQTSDIGFSLTRNTCDSTINPTKGTILGGTFDVAGGFLGGDKDFYRFQGNGSYFQPLWFNSVLEFRGRMGVENAYGDSTKVPIFERFFAGGARTIRGYDERAVGPLDSQTNDPIGGESLIVGNIEYTIPLIQYIKLAGFFDTGNVWSKMEDLGKGNFKSGTGLGLRVKTPIGPVNLDYGIPLSIQEGQKRSGKFYFSVSRGF
ncbi:MAG: outer membrane protein assembly factor BamA [Candidatus Omnitrophica bacterium]|nr:outer membrane protein assembly factor BamA [Candidatus Omnitrophota bacterium]